ncbi:T9SS type B sorting domain-containing protein [Capnocytophaga canis]|uniref:T9SS type B sorting domain-containing protein n=2 Tax=Capnocytophaga canis TaxID=1848903 RepID=UPI001562E732|nr:T9SS type B sorting domain-containing protein [Capnocytophaga canis]
MNRFLLTIVLLFTVCIAKSQNLDDFTVTPEPGDCYSNSKIKVNLGAGNYAPAQLTAEIQLPPTPGLPSTRVQEFDTSEYIFGSLQPGTYTITVINENGWVRSQPKVVTIPTTYVSTQLTKWKVTASSCNNTNDAKVSFTIVRNTGKGPNFEVSITDDAGNVLVPAQTFTRPNANTDLDVTVQGNATHPLTANQYVFVNVQDMTGITPNCELRKERVSIPPINPSVDCIEIEKMDGQSRIQTNMDCKRRISFRIQRKDGRNDMAPIHSYISENNSGIAIVKRTKRDALGNIIEEAEYDITSSFSANYNIVAEYNSFVSDYVFEDGDEVEVTINIGMTPIREKFTLTPMDPMQIVAAAPNQTPIGIANYSHLDDSCQGHKLLYAAPYYQKVEFPNTANPSDPAGYHKYEWYQDFSLFLTDDELYNQGKDGYYFEIYKWEGTGTPNLNATVGWKRKTQVPIPAGHPLYMPHDVIPSLQWNDRHDIVDVTDTGYGHYKVVYKKTGLQSCYEPKRMYNFQPVANQISQFFDGLYVGKGLFENTVSFRKWISAVSFNYPLEVTIEPISVPGATPSVPPAGTATFTMTFNTSLPLDNGVQHQRSIVFPVKKIVPNAEVVNSNVMYGDFPKGKYRITVKDKCGNTDSREIDFEEGMTLGENYVKPVLGCEASEIHYAIGSNVRRGTVLWASIVLEKKRPDGTYGPITSQRLDMNDPRGTFVGLEAGEYRVRAYSFSYDKHAVWKRSGSGYVLENLTDVMGVAGYTLIPEYLNALRPGGQEIHRGSVLQIELEKELELPRTKPLQVSAIGTSCGTAAGTGMAIMYVQNREDVRYPLTFTLYKQDGTEVASVTYDADSEADSHIFRNLSDEDYTVKVSHQCTEGIYDVRVKADTYAPPRITASPESQNPCNGDVVRLAFSGSEVLFNVEWFKIKTDGSLESIGTGATITQTVMTNTQFQAEYTLKDTSICGVAVGVTSPVTVAFIPDTTPPVISGCPASAIVVNAPANACDAVVTWGTVTATDNCGFTHTQTHQSGDRFPIGIHTVTYLFTDTSGNTSTCTFNVEVKSNALALDIQADYIDGNGNVLNRKLALNEGFQYKIVYKNVGLDDLATATLTVDFSANPYINIGVPTYQPTTLTQMPTYTHVGRVYTFVLPKEILKGSSGERAIYIPLTMNATYAEIGTPCMNIFGVKYEIEYQRDNQLCAAGIQTKTGVNPIQISTKNDIRSELFCVGSSLELKAKPGFTSYKWFKNGVEIPSATGSSYIATEAAEYMVEKTTVCSDPTLGGNITVTCQEIIRFESFSSNLTADPIRALANGGATCGADGRWTSHFILCNEPSKEITVNFRDSNIQWQRFRATCSPPNDGRCQNYNNDCWESIPGATGSSFTVNAAGRYRLKVSSANGCEAHYYFEVFMNGLSGEVVQPVGHITNYQPGHFNVKMATEGVIYQYTIKDPNGQTYMDSSNAANIITYDQYNGGHDITVRGISVPGTYTIEVKSGSIANCSTILRATVEERKNLTTTATVLSWSDCNNVKVRFGAQGGKAPYRFAIWKIDGVQRYPDYTSIPDTAFIATIPEGSVQVDQDVHVTQLGRYIFVVKDANGAYAETVSPGEMIRPEGITDYTINVKNVACGDTSGVVSVTFTTAHPQDIITRLHRLQSGTRVQTFENASGIYAQGIVQGKYELEVIITQGSRVCTYVNPIEIGEDENTLKAFAGVVEDKSCDTTNSPKRYKVHINNVSGGTGTGYMYKSEGGSYTTSNVVYLSGSGNVYVRDSAKCEIAIPVTITDIPSPEVNVSTVMYSCLGKGTFTVTASPAGTYEYEVVGGGITERNTSGVFTLDAGNYSVYVYHQSGSSSATTPNVLFQEDFGTGNDTCNNSIIYMTCKPNEELQNSQYVITKQVTPRAEWTTPTDASGVVNGRYLAVNANSNQGNLGVIYTKNIKDIVAGQDVKVSVKLYNLLKSTYIGGVNPNLDFVLLTSGGVELKRISLGQILADEKWHSRAVTFSSADIGTNTEVIFQIVSKEPVSTSVGSDVAVDDILIWQETKVCNPRTDAKSVVIEAAKAFTVTGSAEDAACDGLGKLKLRIENRNGSDIVYSLDNANWTTITPTATSVSNVDTAVIPNLAAVTSGTVYVRKQNEPSCLVELTYTINALETVSITTQLLRVASCNPMNADVKVMASGGARPYQSVTAVPSGGISTVANMVNNEAVFDGARALAPGTYELRLTDANGCVTTSTLKVDAPKTLTLEANSNNACLLPGEKAEVTIQVLDGNGNYRYSKDGVNFTPPSATAEYTFEELNPGVYVFKVIDGANCSTTITVDIPEPLTLNVQPTRALTCATGSNAVFELNASGGNPAQPKQFLWSNDGVSYVSTNVVGITMTASGNRATFTTNVEGIYYFKVVVGSCERIVSRQEVKISRPQFKTTLTKVDAVCHGSETGRINVSLNDIQGGTAPYELLLFDGVSTTTQAVGNIVNLKANTYRLTVRDANNCLSDSQTITIGDAPQLNVTVTTQDVRCIRGAGGGISNGEVEINLVSGGVAPFSIELHYKDVPHGTALFNQSNVNIGDVIRIPNLIPHEYEYTITDANGCITKNTFHIHGTSDKIIAKADVVPGCDTASLVVSAYSSAAGSSIARGSHWIAIYKQGMTIPSPPMTPPSPPTWIDGGNTWYAGTVTDVTTVSGTTVSGTTATIPGLTPGAKYRFIVYDSSTKCYVIEEVTQVPTASSTLSITLTPTTTTCRGSNDGKIDFEVKGMNPMITHLKYQAYYYATHDPVLGAGGSIAVPPGVTSATIQTGTVLGLPAGKVYVVFTEETATAPHCRKASEPVVVPQAPMELVIQDLSIINDNCQAGGQGSISVDARHGVAPYKYYYHNESALGIPPAVGSPALTTLINNSTDGHTVSGLDRGTWHVFVRDNNGCIKTRSVTVDEDKAPEISSVVLDNPCTSDKTAYSVRLNLTKVGTGQHYYRVKLGGMPTADWMPMSVSPYATSVSLPVRLQPSTQTYTIELKDANDCATSEDIKLYSQVKYEVVTPLIHCGAVSADIVIKNLTGGSGKYAYTINKVETVLDPINHTTSEIFVPITGMKTTTAGTVTVTISPGVLVGSYAIRLYDEATRSQTSVCPEVRNFSIDLPEIPEMEVLSLTNPTCSTGTGSARVKVSPSVLAPYTFTIENPTTSMVLPATSSGVDYAVFDGLSGSLTGETYVVSAVATNGCVVTKTVVVTTPAPLVLASNALTMESYQCVGNTTSLPTLTFDLSKVSGGTQSYTRVEFYEQSSVIPVNIKVISQGTTSYTYTLTDHVAATQTYTVKVFDANGCEVITPAVTVTPTLVLSSVTATRSVEIDCTTNQEVVSVTVTTSVYNGETLLYEVIKRNANGTETTEFTRSVATTTQVFSLPIGNYTIRVTNPATNCFVTTAYDVHEPNSFLFTASNIVNVKCYGEATGAVTLNFSDMRLGDGNHAAAGFEFVISPVTGSAGSTVTGTVTGGTVTTVTNLLAGNYQMIAKALSNQCSTEPVAFEILQSERPLAATATQTYGVTCLDNKGEILIKVTGGEAPYQVILHGSSGYVSSPQIGGNIITNEGEFLFTGLTSNGSSQVYTVQVIDRNGSGCQDNSVTITLVHPTPITATATVIQNVTCKDAANGIIEIANVAGGSGSPTYFFELRQGTATVITQESPRFENLAPGEYEVWVMDAWNCDQKIGELNVTEPEELSLKVVSAELVVCHGEATAWINYEVHGGTAPYEVSIVKAVTGAVISTDTAFLGNVARGLSKGKYEVHITDAQGCTMSPVYEFEVEETPNLEATATQIHDCQDNKYTTWIEVKFKHTVDPMKLSYKLGSKSERVFARFDTKRNVAIINANGIDQTQPLQVLTIFHRDEIAATGQVVLCSYTLGDPVKIENLMQLDEVKRVANDEINTIQVAGKDGQYPYTYVFNGQNQGGNGVYKLKITDPEEIGEDGKRYKVIDVIIYDAVGCTVTATIKELFHDITIPNYFTPDGDGNNDTWTPKYIDEYPYARTHIFDRYGRKIKTLKVGESWDGIYNGKPLPSGDYWYLLELNSDIDPRKFKGNFTIYR